MVYAAKIEFEMCSERCLHVKRAHRAHLRAKIRPIFSNFGLISVFLGIFLSIAG